MTTHHASDCPSLPRRRPRSHSVATLCLAAAMFAGACAQPAPDASQLRGAATLEQAIERAADAYGVPREVLMAVAWAEGRWIDRGIPTEDNGVPGSAHAGVEIGPLHLRHGNNGVDALARAQTLLGVDERALRDDLGLQVAGAAAVLAEIGRATDARVDDVDSWAEAVARYSGIVGRSAQVDYARHVWEALRQGRREETFTGERMFLAGRNGATIEQLLHVDQVAESSADYGPARWVAASSSNYTGGRGGNPVQYIVIHDMEGSYTSAINWFQNPSAMASAHYCVRSSDGEVTQMVRESDTAWHAGNWFYNQHSVGIEHEGYVASPDRWFTEAMYVSSARLVRNMVDRYRIPIDRSHIIGHYQIPPSGSGAPCATTATGCGGSGHHTDPGNGGTGWNWTHYMDLIRGGGTVMPMYDADLVTVNYPRNMMSGERAVAYVEYRNTGTASWDTTNTRLGTTAPRDHAGRLYDMVNWLNRNRPTAVDRATAPGAVGRFSFMVQAPTVTTDTVVTESYGLVQESVAWFGPPDMAVTFTINVHAVTTPPDDAGPSTDSGPAPDDAAVADTGPVVDDAGTEPDTGEVPPTDSGARPSTDSGVRADARSDGGTGGMPRGGCGCRIERAARDNGLAGWNALACLAAAGAYVVRRTRRRSRARTH